MSVYGVGSPLARPRARWLLLAAGLAILTLHATLFMLDVSPSPRGLVGDERMYFEQAQRLAAGGELERDPLWPPLYFHFVALCLRLGGGALGAVWLAQTLLLLALAVLLSSLARHWLGEGPHVWFAAALPLLDPTLAAFAHFLWPEILHAVFFAAALWILAARRDRLLGCAAFGIVLGLALLTKSLLTPFLPILFLALCWKQPLAQALPRAAIALLGLGVALLPTLAESYRATGELYIADSSRFNLWLGLTDTGRRDHTDRRVGEALAEFRASGTTHAERNRVTSAKIFDVVREKGTVRILGDQLGRQYFRLFSRHSPLTDQLPDGPLHREGRGYAASSGTVTKALAGAALVFYLALLVAFALALATTPPALAPWWWTLSAFLAYNLGIFLLLHVKTRYRIQLEPYLLLWAACGASAWWSRSKTESPANRRRITVGLAGAAALVALALGS